MTTKELLVILSSNIKKYRNRQKWTQAELAEKVNISINFLSDIETSKKWPSPDTLVKFAETFKVEAYELLKSDHILPDNFLSLIEKHKEDIYLTITEVHSEYVKKSEKKNQ